NFFFLRIILHLQLTSLLFIKSCCITTRKFHFHTVPIIFLDPLHDPELSHSLSTCDRLIRAFQFLIHFLISVVGSYADLHRSHNLFPGFSCIDQLPEPTILLCHFLIKAFPPSLGRLVQFRLQLHVFCSQCCNFLFQL